MRAFAMAVAGLAVAAFGAAAAPAGAGNRIVAAAPSLEQPTDWSAAKKRQRARAAYAGARPQGQIACTQFGCRTVPRGCRPVEQRYWDGDPTGFDAVVCSRR